MVVKRDRKFYVGQFIYYANEYDLRGMSTGCTPPWERGRIWKIEDNRLFINRN